MIIEVSDPDMPVSIPIPNRIGFPGERLVYYSDLPGNIAMLSALNLRKQSQGDFDSLI